MAIEGSYRMDSTLGYNAANSPVDAESVNGPVSSFPENPVFDVADARSLNSREITPADSVRQRFPVELQAPAHPLPDAAVPTGRARSGFFFHKGVKKIRAPLVWIKQIASKLFNYLLDRAAKPKTRPEELQSLISQLPEVCQEAVRADREVLASALEQAVKEDEVFSRQEQSPEIEQSLKAEQNPPEVENPESGSEPELSEQQVDVAEDAPAQEPEPEEDDEFSDALNYFYDGTPVPGDTPAASETAVTTEEVEEEASTVQASPVTAQVVEEKAEEPAAQLTTAQDPLTDKVVEYDFLTGIPVDDLNEKAHNAVAWLGNTLRVGDAFRYVTRIFANEQEAESIERTVSEAMAETVDYEVNENMGRRALQVMCAAGIGNPLIGLAIPYVLDLWRIKDFKEETTVYRKHGSVGPIAADLGVVAGLNLLTGAGILSLKEVGAVIAGTMLTLSAGTERAAGAREKSSKTS